MENVIAYRCLSGFSRRYFEVDIPPKLNKLKSFVALMNGNYTGENLVAKLIDTDEYWDNMLNTQGFGRGKKYERAVLYRKNLKETWNIILEKFRSKNETDISKLMGLLLWDLNDDDFSHSYLGVIECAMKQNKLWNNPIASDIFCSYYDFIQGVSKTQEEIAHENSVDRERVRQLKEKYIASFNEDFWFLKDDLIKEKLEALFDLNALTLEQLGSQIIKINEVENVKFTQEFYTYILSVGLDMVLVGNINDIKNLNKRSSRGNIWSNLYLQTQDENERCNLENLIHALAIEMHNHRYYFEVDESISLTPYVSNGLSEKEIDRYRNIISKELECETELNVDSVVIKRNSLVTQPEMVESALKSLGGFAYANDILEKVIDLYPKKEWSMPILRTSFRGDNFYSVGKSGLFGLINMKDLRSEMGNGTLNDIMRIYMLSKDSPAHIYELFKHINNLFPRPKTLKSIHSILEQNSKEYFKKFNGGFYGLLSKIYENTDFPCIVGGHGTYMKNIIEASNGVAFEYVLNTFNEKYGLLEIQIQYLLDQMIEVNKISLLDGLYQRYIASETTGVDEDEIDVEEEIDVELDQEELNFEELNQPEVPNELLKDYVAQINIRRGQPRFRQRLLKFYKNTCIITGCKIPELLEAAHVLPHSEQKDYSLSNGLLLRADIHTLFDLGMIAINPENLCLKLKTNLMESDDYKNLNDINIASKLLELHPDYKINEKGLFWRWENFEEFE